MDNKILACEEHIDEALDEFIVEKETFPILEKVQEGVCSFCEKDASYSLEKQG
ncbi:CxxH/CxxC protein [Clostridium sp. 'White wine YQ']|uniref:CxxH/CxxC protein n=1 Tax=Clostridium sp. 'White wine YQ' TaxID=3027474 RepID=UPI00236732B3|nr:CxxH/CxxC protein [Clostridium sp. 'White wine YQ']MDD7796275.1 CxxH/CxxC protein [Clostridium sp. 'White wine YQ']